MRDMQSRTAPQNHDKMTHQNIVHWFNELVYDIKVFLDAGHPALITPTRWHSWDRYRTELLECDHFVVGATRGTSKHLHAIQVIDALMADLEAIWYRRPHNVLNESRIAELDDLYNGLQECKTPRVYY